jgi:3-hydroxybutyryl-CoA dehydratase
LVWVGDTLLATAEVVHVDREKNRVKLRTRVTIQEEVEVLDGEATVSPPKKRLTVIAGGAR